MRTTVLSIQGALITTTHGALTMRLGRVAEAVGFQTMLVGIGIALGGLGTWLWTRRPRMAGLQHEELGTLYLGESSQ